MNLRVFTKGGANLKKILKVADNWDSHKISDES